MESLPILEDTIECSCHTCVQACLKKPGWFAPGEIKPAADLLGMTEEDFFKKYLSVDYWTNPDANLFVLSPAIVGETPGQEFPLEPTGKCVFLTDEGKCSIHAAKPYECRSYDHRQKRDDSNSEHLAVAESWVPHKDYISKLLGREPEITSLNPFDMLMFIAKRLEDAFK